MKRVIITVWMVFLIPLFQYAENINLGLLYGLRIINNSAIKNTYGNGTAYSPRFSVDIWNGFALGGGYEDGSSKGFIGLYQEAATLQISGLEVFFEYHFDTQYISPFLRVGYGSFLYRQTINSSSIGNIEVKKTVGSAFAALGIKAFPFLARNFYIVGEIKYVPLKVKPYDKEVDLSGIRYWGGIGFAFEF